MRLGATLVLTLFGLACETPEQSPPLAPDPTIKDLLSLCEPLDPPTDRAPWTAPGNLPAAPALIEQADGAGRRLARYEVEYEGDRLVSSFGTGGEPDAVWEDPWRDFHAPVYDARGLLRTIPMGDGGCWAYFYDEDDRLVNRIELSKDSAAPNERMHGQEHRHSYEEESGRLVGILRVSFDYNALRSPGEGPKMQRNLESTQSFAYDTEGRLSAYAEQAFGETRTVTYEYDERGRLREATRPGARMTTGFFAPGGHTKTALAYDEADHLLTVDTFAVDADPRVETDWIHEAFNYDDQGRLSERRYLRQVFLGDEILRPRFRDYISRYRYSDGDAVQEVWVDRFRVEGEVEALEETLHVRFHPSAKAAHWFAPWTKTSPPPPVPTVGRPFVPHSDPLFTGPLPEFF